MKALALPGLAATLLIAGCSSLTGLGGSDKFGCGLPEGVQCEPVSSVYARAVSGEAPRARPTAAQPAAAPLPVAPTELSSGFRRASLRIGPTLEPGTPIRSAPRELRVWVAPWEDADGDLHDQSFVYVQVDNGRWLVDHVKRKIRDQYAPLAPPATAAARPPAATAPSPQQPFAALPREAGDAR